MSAMLCIIMFASLGLAFIIWVALGLCMYSLSGTAFDYVCYVIGALLILCACSSVIFFVLEMTTIMQNK